MKFRDDDRGASAQVGAIILFGFLVVAIAGWQATVVPQDNAEVEYTHSQQVTDDMQDVRNAIVSAPGDTSLHSIAVDMAPEYPPRTLFVNPGPPSGTLRTVGTANESLNVTVANARATDDNTADFWNGSVRAYNTGGLIYSPGYNVYTGAPDTVYENSVLYDAHGDGTVVTATGQNLVEGRTISLVALNGSLARTTADSYTVDPRALSSSSRTVSVNNSSGGNLTISFASTRNAAWWNETLHESGELVEDNGSVVDVRSTSLGEFERVTVELEGNTTYRLQMAKVGVGSRTAGTEKAYLVDVAGNGSSVPEGSSQKLVVEVRDRFNNPVAGVLVNASARKGAIQTSPKRTGDDGRVTFTYEAHVVHGTSSERDLVNVTMSGAVDPAAGVDGTTPENVTMALTVENSDGSGLGAGGGGSAYTIDWDPPDSLPGNPSTGLDCNASESCTWDVGETGTTIIDMRANTSRTTANLGVDFGVNDSTVAYPDPSDAETDGDGAVTTDLVAQKNGTVEVVAVSGGDVAEINVTVTNFTIGNLPPTADFDYSPSPPKTKETVTFDGSLSSDPESNITDYEWDLDGDGNFDDATGTTTTHSFADDGSYDVSLRVTDNESKTDTETRTVTVLNRPPNASFTASCDRLNCTFDATGASDPDGNVTSYDWAFGDGDTATGVTTSHTYDSPGTYTVNLTVTDDDGATDTESKPVVVTDNQQPTANFTYSPTGPLTNETVEFDPSASSDPDGTIVEYRWDLDGDGTDDTVTTSATNVTWNYADDGDFNVTLEVVDNDSATDTESKTVAVQNRPPMANFTHSPTRPVTGEAVTFDATNSTDPDGTVDYYAWDFDGDGTVDQNTTSATIEHTYDSSGEQNVSLTVTDDDGARNTTNTTVQVVGGRPHVAYVDPGTQDGRTIDRGGRISQFDMTGAAEAIGPPTTDFDGDGLVEVPYVTSSNNLKVVDRNGERTQLRTGDVRGSGLTVGRFGTDEPAIYWANVNDDTTVYRTYYNGTTETIGSFGNSVKAVGGIGDVDDDGADELVVVVGGPTLAYVDDDGNTLKAQSDFIGSNNNWGIGRVADYDGDGAERVAVVDGSNNVLLVSCSKKDANMADCTTTDVASGTAAKTVLGAFDWNDDGEAEVMFADTSDPAKLSYANVTGSGTGAGADVTTVRDENDDTVSVYVEGGVASIHRARPVRRPASG